MLAASTPNPPQLEALTPLLSPLITYCTPKSARKIILRPFDAAVFLPSEYFVHLQFQRKARIPFRVTQGKLTTYSIMPERIRNVNKVMFLSFKT